MGHAGRPRQAGRHRALLRHLREPARRLPGTTGPSSIEPGDRRALRPRLPALQRPRPRQRPPRAAARARRRARCTRRSAARSAACRRCSGRSTSPHEVERAVLICASARLSAQNIGVLQGRRAPRSPRRPRRHGLRPHDGPHHLPLRARGWSCKFDRERRAAGPMTMASDFEVEHYLDHQAEIFLDRFDPLTYLYLSRVDGLLRPVRGAAGARRTRASWLVSFSSDWRFGSEHSRDIAARAGGARRRRPPRGDRLALGPRLVPDGRFRATRTSSRSSWRRFSICAQRWPGRATRSRSSTRRCCPARRCYCG